MRIITEEEARKHGFIPGIDVYKIEIVRICRNNTFSQGIEKKATEIYSKLHRIDYKKLDKLATPLAAVYLACKEKGLKVTLEQIDSKASPFPPDIDKKHLENMRKLRLKRTREHLAEIRKLKLLEKDE